MSALPSSSENTSAVPPQPPGDANDLPPLEDANDLPPLEDANDLPPLEDANDLPPLEDANDLPPLELEDVSVAASPPHQPENVRTAARRHHALGRVVVPLPRRCKAPNVNGWQHRRFKDQQLALLDLALNLGLQTGTPSGGLTDIDLDCPEALALAPTFLPPTAMRHGRPSSPDAHHWYLAQGAQTTQYRDPTNRKMLVELRAGGNKGFQTMIPPSVHPSGERLAWAGGIDGKPASVETTRLQRAVAMLAVASLLARHYPVLGSRHEHALALAGFLLQGGIAEADAYRIVRAVARVGGSTDPAARAAAVHSTAQKIANGVPVTGAKRLAEILGGDGPKIVAAVAKWLGFHGGGGSATSAGKKASTGPAQSADHPYAIQGGRIGQWKRSRDGGERYFDPLTNFSAQIVEELHIDDGVDEPRHVFRITGTLADGALLPEAHIDAARYSDLKWIAPSWGARPVVVAGRGAGEQVREAIQRLSTPARRTTYAHTGWREIEGRFVYLHVGGAVGIQGISVELPGPLARYRLSDPDPAIPLVEAVRASLAIRALGPLEITIPLLASVYAAPVASLVESDFAVWIAGATGCFKTELAALAQAHFGEFDREHLPADWLSTENALEARLFATKDALCVIDDYAPQSDPRAQREIERKAQRIIRAVGNRSARSRLRPDLSQRPDRPPRGLLVATGEDIPPGESILARLVVVEVDRAAIDLGALTQSQMKRPLLAHALRGYLAWLAPQYRTIAPALRDRRQSYAEELRGASAHPRAPLALAHLRVGIDLLMRFAQEVGALDADGAEQLHADAAAAFRAVCERGARPMAEVRPAERYIAVVRSQLATERGRLRPAGTMAIDVPGGDPIGWMDAEYVYLDPEDAYRRVVTHYRDTGQSFSVSKSTAHKDLARAGYIVPATEGGETRYEVQRRFDGRKLRVLRVPRAVLGLGDDDGGAK